MLMPDGTRASKTEKKEHSLSEIGQEVPPSGVGLMKG